MWWLIVYVYFLGSKQLLTGPSDFGEPCPSTTFKYTYSGRDYCCCSAGCCWDKCGAPPSDCLQGVSGGTWIHSVELNYFQAFASTIGTLESGINVHPWINIAPWKIWQKE